MTKEKFVQYINKIVELSSIENNIRDAFIRLNPDFNYVSFSVYEELIVKILKDAVDDKWDWIEYWLFELDYGRKARKRSVTGADGKNIPINTPEDLYELIKRDDC